MSRIKKVILGCVFTLFMGVGLISITTKQAYASTDISVNISADTRKNIYANGNAIILQAGSTTGYTNIIIDANRDGVVDLGEEPIDLNHSTYFDGILTGDITTGFELYDTYVRIFGGSEASAVAQTKITMLGGKVYDMYGGGAASGGDVNGNTVITLSGGSVRRVLGGGMSGASVTGSTNILLDGAEVGVSIYGGGEAYLSTNSSVGSTSITIKSGVIVASVYGGGAGASIVNGDTNITITGGTFQYGSIYGGGLSAGADVTGTCYMTITNVSSLFTYNIYGGGNSASVGGTSITINGSRINNIVGGGNSGKVNGNTSITLNSTEVVSRVVCGGTGSGSFIGSGSGDASVAGIASISNNGGRMVELYMGGDTASGICASSSATIAGGCIGYASGGISKGFVTGTSNLVITGGNINSVDSNISTITNGSVNVFKTAIRIGNVDGGIVTSLKVSSEGAPYSYIVTGTRAYNSKLNAYLPAGAVTTEAVAGAGATYSNALGITTNDQGTATGSLNYPVTFNRVDSNGASNTTTTTQLTLIFSNSIYNLSIDNITVTGATKGTLSGSDLTISDITVENGGAVTVTIASPVGYMVTPASMTATVYKKYIPTLTDITLTPTSIEDKKVALAGTKVADLAATGTPSTGITYTLDGTGDNNNLFQISGTQLQIKSGTTLSEQSYTVKVKVQEDAKALNTFTKTISFSPTIIDTTPPSVTSITRQSPSAEYTNAGSVTFRITFSEEVSGVDASDFQLISTGTASGIIASVSPISDKIIDVIVNTVTGQGTLRLDLKASGTGITDIASNVIGVGYTTGQVYSVDRIAPSITSITRQTPSVEDTNASSVTYRVTFNESVTGVDAGDFALTKTGTAAGSIVSVALISGNTIDVTVNAVEGQGTIRLDAVASGTGITDSLGNAIEAGYTVGQTYSVDRSAPSLTAGAVTRNSDTNAIVKFTTNEAGKYYYIVVASGDAQPDISTSGVGIDCSAGENTITLITLNAGAKDIYIVVKDAFDYISDETFKISIPAYVAPPSNGNGNGGGGNVGGATDNSKKESKKSVEISVNDIVLKAGTIVDTKKEGKTVTTVSLDEKMIVDQITAEGKNTVITIPIHNTPSDMLVAELNGQIVKNLESKAAVIEVKTDAAAYTLPAMQIDIESISKQLGNNLELSDIKVKVEIAKTSATTNELVENVANRNKFTILASPVEFNVNCTYGNQTVEVSKFNNYVERMVQIPTGIDTKSITTGVVVDADGTVRHVPTKIIFSEGKYYAKINSLTNSTYTVIYNTITYQDVINNPARDAINDLGSRMVISGAKNDLFRPDSKITRAEFTAMLVTSLGLTPGTKDTLFTDVKLKDWYSKYIEAANEYGIISGDTKSKFRPKDKITTEEAMTMLKNAMQITGLKAELKKGEEKKLLVSLAKSGQAQVWADNSIAACIKAGIVTVKGKQKISPKGKLTRAEAAVMIRLLLVKSDLI